MATLNATSTPKSISKEQLSTRIIKNSTQLLEDYVLWHKCGWSDEEFGSLLGISAKTVKNRYLADARKQGLIEASKHSNDAAKRTARNRALPVENSTPTITLETFRHQNDDSFPTTVQLLNTTECIEPSVCYVQPNVGTNMGSDQELVSMGTKAERDLARVYALFDEIGGITGRYLLGGWSEGDWNGIGGECRTIEDCCNMHSANLRKRLKQQSEAIADSFTFDAKGAPSLRQSDSNNDE